MLEDDATITISSVTTEGDGSSQAMFPSLHGLVHKSADVAANRLATSLSQFVATLGLIVQELPDSCGRYDVEELSFSASVDASGAFSLVGELSAGVTSGITIVLKKRGS